MLKTIVVHPLSTLFADARNSRNASRKRPVNKCSPRARRAGTFVTMGLVLSFIAGSLPVASVQAQSPAETQKLIQRYGFLQGGNSYWARARAKYGKSKTLRAGNLIATKASRGNMTETVGDHPLGFGKGFIWDRKDDEILLVMFINTADDLGISVTGLQEGDHIQILSASGVASFSEDKGNPLASSIVGLIATGAKAGLGLAGVPEAVPIVNKAEEFAQSQFKGTGKPSKRRDAFGVDPGSGHKAKEEGGLLVVMPEAGGTYYSGDDNHKNRWIKMPGDRTDANRPEHVKAGFFPMQADASHNYRTIHGNTFSPLYVLAWDWKFEDNTGYYKVFMHIKKPTANGPVIEKRGR